MSYEPEFMQAYNDLLASLENSTLFQKHPEYRTALRAIVEPERVIQFRVIWEDDNGCFRMNRGYRLIYNSALGACKGGMRFHPSVNLSVLKFLGLSQVFKNALTGLGLGGAKGGSDFDPKDKSDSEIRRFCQAFMTKLKDYISVYSDIPGGDIGVSEREIGWLAGQYKMLQNSSECVITGKGVKWGGSYGRKEAAGFGVAYYANFMIKHRSSGQESLKGKRVAISGSGNVATHAAIKAIQLGAIVVSISDSKGCLVSDDDSDSGVTLEVIKAIQELKVKRKQISKAFDMELFPGLRYIANSRPWKHVKRVDVVLPCATQNEISGDEAMAVVEAGCKYVAEGSNMGCTAEASELFETHRKTQGSDGVWFAPGKAANAGGVAVSGLEASQNNCRETWTLETIDSKLQGIMETTFQTTLATAREYTTQEDEELPSLVIGTNIAGFVLVADAMHEQGQWW